MGGIKLARIAQMFVGPKNQIILNNKSNYAPTQMFRGSKQTTNNWIPELEEWTKHFFYIYNIFFFFFSLQMD